jgi:hypothetical protein
MKLLTAYNNVKMCTNHFCISGKQTLGAEHVLSNSQLVAMQEGSLRRLCRSSQPSIMMASTQGGTENL